MRVHAETHSFVPVPSPTKSLHRSFPEVQRESEATLQAWIDSSHPSPFHVLRKIAEMSPNHRSILLLLAEELEKTSDAVCRTQPSSPPEPAADLIEEERTEIESEIAALSQREEELTAMIQDLNHQREELAEAVCRMKRILTDQTFERYQRTTAQRSERKSAQVMAAETKYRNREATRYNELWGERQQLKETVVKLKDKLENERLLQEKYAENRATARLDTNFV
jgi:chromosome segregation ATPase